MIESHRIESEFDLVVSRHGNDGGRITSNDLDIELSYDCIYSIALRLAEILAEIDASEPALPQLQLVTKDVVR